MKRMLQKTLLGMMLLSLLITGIPVPSLAEEAPVTEVPVTETIVEEAETVVPAAEPAEDAAPAPEEVPVQQPAEAAAEVPVQTAEAEEEIQVPEGFDVAVLQAARASSACQHKNFYVNSECEYTDTVKLDETYHVYTITYTSRSLVCDDCGDVIQTIAWNRVEQHRYRHTWYNFNSKEKNHMYCDDCGATKVVKYPCSHKSLFLAEDGIYHCGKCDAIWDPWTDSYEPSGSYICPHRNYTIHYPGEIGTLYCQDWNETSHLRVYAKLVYDKDEPADTDSSYMATCNDCGVELDIFDGKIIGVDISARYAFWETDHSVLEPHTLVNGECSECGYTVEPPVYQPAPKPNKITLSPAGTAYVNLGDTLNLDVISDPENAECSLTWKTSNGRVATVENGQVRGVSEGSVRITATTNNGKSASVTVKVVDPYKPTKVTLDKTGTVQLNLGETLQLTPSLTPATAQADYTWKTSSAKIATVSGGAVTPVGEGTATITVTAVRGKVKKIAKVKIKVVDPMKPTRVSLNETGTCWLPMGNTMQLYPYTAPVDLNPAKGEVTYSWKSSSAKIATVDQNGVVYPMGKGTATITVTATRGKVKKTASVKVKVVAPDVADTLIFMQNGTALTSLKLSLGQMAFIGVSVRPYTASNVQISYRSSKPQTASVETSPSGEVVVMGLNPGTTTITATDTISGKKTTLKVTVTR